MTGVVKDRHGTCYARRKVPKALQQAVAQVLGSDRERHVFLKRSLGTKDIHEANIRAKPVQQQFDHILEQARALLKERPKRERLSPIEIRLLTDYHFASTLASDEGDTRDGLGSQDAPLRSVAKQLEDAGVEINMPLPLDTSRPRAPTPWTVALSSPLHSLRPVSASARWQSVSWTASAVMSTSSPG